MENDFKKDFSYSDANDQSYNSSEELMQQALPLYDLSDNENPLPEKTLQAYEFLKKGRLEADSIDKSKLFSLKAFEIKPKSINLPKDYQEIDYIPPEVPLSNNTIWLQNTIKSFNQLKKTLQTIKENTSISLIYNLKPQIIVNPLQFLSDPKQFLHNFNEITPENQINPVLSLLIHIDSNKAGFLLELVFLELQKAFLTNNSVCSYYQALWIYSILGCLELPLVMETCGVLVQLKRLFLRFMEVYGKEYQDYYSYIGMINVLVCLIERVFGQK